MESARRQALRASLAQRLATQPEPARLRWLADQLENYLERWLAFRSLGAASPPADDELFAMLELGCEAVTNELRRATPATATAWSTLAGLVARVREHGDEDLIGQLRPALAQVRSSL